MPAFGPMPTSGIPLGKPIRVSNAGGGPANVQQASTGGPSSVRQAPSQAQAPKAQPAPAQSTPGGIPMGDKADCPVCRGGVGRGNPLRGKR